MSTITENYIGYEALVFYLRESRNLSYCRFLSLNHGIIIASLTQLTHSPLTLTNWQIFDITWYKRFLDEAKELLEPDTFIAVKEKINSEHLRYTKKLQTFWKGVIKEYEKKNLSPAETLQSDESLIKETVIVTENLIPAETLQSDTSLSKRAVTKECEKENLIPAKTLQSDSFLTKETVIEKCEKENIVTAKTSQPDALHSKKEVKVLGKNQSENSQLDTSLLPSITAKIPVKNLSKTLPKKNIKLINFCYDILYELENESYANLFYKYTEKNVKNRVIKHPMDLFTINSKLENNQYTSLEEFEKDIRLIFHNCYICNDIESEVYCSGEILESIFNKKWNEKLILQDRQIRELKRVRDNDDEDIDRSWKKQIQILEQNKDNLLYRQVVNDALLVASAYESLIIGNIIPFIDILKTFLLTRSKMTLSSADETMLQAIVESLLPLKYRIPELSLVMNGKKPKGSGRFGYSDIFILKGIEDIYYISLELKYISLVGLIRNQKDKFDTNELENLDKILEKENEEILLKRQYTYWSKESKKINQTTIGEILNSGVSQLESYMDTISKGKVVDYSSSGIFDERVKIIRSNPNKLKGFVIIVIGFRRILWKPVEEVISNYKYNKI